MLNSEAVWRILTEHAPRGDWLGLDELYALVSEHASLDANDNVAVSTKSGSPRWKRTVRNVLQRKKSAGALEWESGGRFRLPRA